MRIIPIPDNINIEVICMQLMVSRRVKLDVISAFRPPRPNPEVFFQQLDEVVDVVRGPNQIALCIVGDFNAKTSDWFPSQPTDSAGRHLQLLAASHQLAQVVNGPTFGICSSSLSLLDLVFFEQASTAKKVCYSATCLGSLPNTSCPAIERHAKNQSPSRIRVGILSKQNLISSEQR